MFCLFYNIAGRFGLTFQQEWGFQLTCLCGCLYKCGASLTQTAQAIQCLYSDAVSTILDYMFVVLYQSYYASLN